MRGRLVGLPVAPPVRLNQYSKRSPSRVNDGPRLLRVHLLYMKNPPQIVSTLRDVALLLDVRIEWVRAASRACVCRTSGGRFRTAPIKAWIESHRDELTSRTGAVSLQDQKLEQEIRKLRRANDRMEASLVSRAWLRERFERIGAEIAALAERSIIEDTPRLMAAGPDIACIRKEYKRVWDDIMIGLQNCAEHLREE